MDKIEKKYINFAHICGVIKFYWVNDSVIKIIVSGEKKIGDKTVVESHEVLAFKNVFNLTGIKAGDWIDVLGSLYTNTYKEKTKTSIVATKITNVETGDVFQIAKQENKPKAKEEKPQDNWEIPADDGDIPF